MLDAARGLRGRHGLDGVFTAGTDFSTTVAAVAEGLGLPGLPVAVTQGGHRQGADAHACCGSTACPARASSPWRSPDDCAGVDGRMPFPLVVKPVDNMGARGVRRVDSRAELEEAVALALQASRTRRALVEEYLEGPELSIDAITWQGRITLCGVADRHIRFPPYFVEMGHTMPTALEAAQVRRAAEVFRRGVRALGIDGGAAKGDVKVTARGAFIGEIAARLSGGYMSGWTFPFSSGVEVTAAALRIAVGLPPGSMRPARRWTSAERAFISIPGIVAAVEGEEEIRAGGRTGKGCARSSTAPRPGSGWSSRRTTWRSAATSCPQPPGEGGRWSWPRRPRAPCSCGCAPEWRRPRASSFMASPAAVGLPAGDGAQPFLPGRAAALPGPARGSARCGPAA